MIHPSYNDLMQVVNAQCEPGEEPVVNSRYSIVMATAKRARQIIDGDEPLAFAACDKPFSTAVEELYEGKVKILGEDTSDLSEQTDFSAAEEASVQDVSETEDASAAGDASDEVSAV